MNEMEISDILLTLKFLDVTFMNEMDDEFFILEYSHSIPFLSD